MRSPQGNWRARRFQAWSLERAARWFLSILRTVVAQIPCISATLSVVVSQTSKPYLAAMHRVQYHHTKDCRRMTMKEGVAVFVYTIYIAGLTLPPTPPRPPDGKL